MTPIPYILAVVVVVILAILWAFGCDSKADGTGWMDADLKDKE